MLSGITRADASGLKGGHEFQVHLRPSIVSNSTKSIELGWDFSLDSWGTKDWGGPSPKRKQGAWELFGRKEKKRKDRETGR